MASRKGSAAGPGTALAAAGRERAHLELAELGPLLEEKGEQGAAGAAAVSVPRAAAVRAHRGGPGSAGRVGRGVRGAPSAVVAECQHREA